MSKKLRGQGPKTFVSYAFGNQLAQRLSELMIAEGFQVTLIEDTSLLGKPSLGKAIEQHIQEAEVVVPILDDKANKSAWVHEELTLAKLHHRMILPVVQSRDSLPSVVHDIPYVTEDSLPALIPAALRNFALLPLDPQNPFELLTEALRDYLRSDRSFTRVILDSDDLIGTLIDNLPEALRQATKETPKMQTVLERQVREPLDHCQRMMNRVQAGLPRFRTAMEHALSSYGAKRIERSIIPWQRMIKLVIGQDLLTIASTLPPEFCPGFWGQGAMSVNAALKLIDAVRLTDGGNKKVIWALQVEDYEVPHAWLEVSFHPTKGNVFNGYIPASTHISESVKSFAKPEAFLEPYQWADFVLPQLIWKAVLLSDRFTEDKFIKEVAWNLSDYRKAEPAT
jgi:hypothetical protein